MKFSTETIETISKILVQDYQKQIAKGEEIEIDEIEQEMRWVLKEIGKESLGEMMSMEDEIENGLTTRCECGYKAKRISRREATILSVFGWVRYQRSYYKCRQCEKNQIPLDEKHKIHPGQASRSMARLLGMAGVTVSFEESQKQIGEYLMVDVSINTIRKETQAIGIRQEQKEEEWITNSQDLAYLQERERTVTEQPKRMYGSIDGALVPIGTDWNEEKTVAWYQAGTRYNTKELHGKDIYYYTSLEKVKKFGELVWGSAVHHNVDLTQEIIFVCDGAAWIWKLVDLYFPKAVQIVDWYHACEYLQPIADTLFTSGGEEKKTWVQEMQDLLWEGEVSDVISACHALLDHPAAADPARSAATYYSNNQARMNYAYFRQQGYFIGSGTVESACKQIVSMRLKRSGARWTFAGAQATAKARAAWLSHGNTWYALTSLPLAV
ncbi:MAG: ISKra4 family transposase [Anaerolineaceae bacterium]|nr:ISKra4 family transposase [Anaerolineaceae bacterium]